MPRARRSGQEPKKELAHPRVRRPIRFAGTKFAVPTPVAEPAAAGPPAEVPPVEASALRGSVFPSRIPRRVLRAQKKLEKLLLARPDAARGTSGIVGVGVGEKQKGGLYTGELCLKVMVEEKLRPQEVREGELVRPEIDGVPTDVVRMSRPRIAGAPMSNPGPAPDPPMEPGNAIFHPRGTVGTAACLVSAVTAPGERTLYVLSNNHVIGAINTAVPGDPIYYRQHLPNGAQGYDYVIGQFTNSRRISFTDDNVYDCSIAQVYPDRVKAANTVMGQWSAQPPVEASVGMSVYKYGETTLLRQGKVETVNFTVDVTYPTGQTARFVNQVHVLSSTAQAFAAGGDSGSLVVTVPDKRLVGLLFAALDDGSGVFCPIAGVLSGFGVNLVR